MSVAPAFASMANLLQRLNDDVKIIILCFLPAADIISLRKTCKRLNVLSRLHIVWQAACLAEVIGQTLTFPYSAPNLPSLSQERLERLTLRALHLHKIWDPVPTSISHSFTFQAAHSVPVAYTKLLGGRNERYLAVVTQGIWSAVTVWDLGPDSHGPARTVAEWSPEESMIVAFAANTESESDGTLAVAIQPNKGGSHGRVFVLSLLLDTEDTPAATLQVVFTIDLPSVTVDTQLVLLQGDHIILCDVSYAGSAEGLVTIMNWKTKWSADLQLRPTHSRRHVQAVIAEHAQQIAILQSTTIDFFAFPPLHPPGAPKPACAPLCKPAPLHTNGTWHDFFTAALQTRAHASAHPHTPVIGIVLREQQADPWSERSGSVRLQECALPAAPHPTPPDPRLVVAHSWRRGATRCPTVVLGAGGTLALLSPRLPGARGLTVLDVPEAGAGAEALVLVRGAATRAVWWNAEESDTWTALDYDEAGGRVVVGSGYGRVTVLVL